MRPELGYKASNSLDGQVTRMGGFGGTLGSGFLGGGSFTGGFLGSLGGSFTGDRRGDLMSDTQKP